MPDNHLRPGGLFEQMLHIMAKDLRIEWRSREVIYTMTLFAVLLVVLFSFSVGRPSQATSPIAGGLLWVVVVFSGTLGIGRLFDREREGSTYRALLLSPVPRAAIYLGKLLSIILFIGFVEVLTVPLIILLYELQVSSYASLLALLLLGTIGFAAVGSLFAATLLHSRNREVLLSIMLYPVVTPVIIAGAKGTAILLDSAQDPGGALVWLKLLLSFDTIFIALSLWAFGPLTRGE